MRGTYSGQIHKAKSRMVIGRSWGWRIACFMGSRVSTGDEKVLIIDGLYTVWMYLMPQKGTLKNFIMHVLQFKNPLTSNGFIILNVIISNDL